MLVLRGEKFGGIVFNSENAVQLSLDEEGFFVFRGYTQGEKVNLRQEERDFVIKVLEMLDVGKEFETKVIENSKYSGRKHFFEVLSSPTLADIQITTRCNLHCPHCYANSSCNGENILWEDLIFALDAFERAGVFQIALGGGEPTLHPRFVQIIEEVRKRGMVPNLTTNGKELSLEIARAMGRYCGAVALSTEGIGSKFEERRNFSWEKFCRSAELLKKCGNKLVFQITVSDSNIEELPRLVDFLLGFHPHGIILLAYKPVGRGRFFDNVLAVRKNDFVKKILEECLDKIEGRTKIGFDCCFVQGVVEMAEESYPFDFKVVEGCSALRNSLAVTKDLDIVPCSFIDCKIGNLKEGSLDLIWFGEKAEEFREKFYASIKNHACANCKLRNQCLGGCPEFDLVRCSMLQSRQAVDFLS
jgi:radical SAM protein with 4Fe4S-binding SPASM domain